MLFQNRRVMRVTIVVVAAFLLPFLLTATASATSYDPNTLSNCESMPGALVNGWNPATSTCTVGSGTLLGTDSLTIDSGFTLVVTGTLIADSGSAITIDGALVINSTGVLEDYGTLTDNAVFTDSGQVNVESSGAATVASAGVLTVTGTGTLYNYGGLAVNGVLNILAGGYAENDFIMADTDLISNNGEFVEATDFTISSAGTFANYGTYVEYGALSQQGTFNNPGWVYVGFVGTIENYGVFNNNFYVEVEDTGAFLGATGSVLNNPDSFYVDAGGNFDSYGTLNNFDGNFFGEGHFSNEVGGTVEDTGDGYMLLSDVIPYTSSNNGTIDISAHAILQVDDAVLTNYAPGIINNAGTFWLGNPYVEYIGDVVNLGTINNALGAVIDNLPTGYPGHGSDFDNSAGTISNSGTIINYCDATFEVGTLSGNPVQFYPCVPAILGPATSSSETPTFTGNMNGWFSSGGGSPLAISLCIGTCGTYLGEALTTDSAGDWSITSGVDLAAGPYTLYAYATDSELHESPWSSAFSFAEVLPTSTTVSCTPTPLKVGTPTTCTVTVTEMTSGTKHTSPTGTVTLTGSPSGIPPSTTCVLSSTGIAGQSQCVATFTPGALGTSTVTASYPGVTNYWQSSSGTYGISSNQLGTSTSLSCGALIVNDPATCTATINDVPTAVIPPGGSLSVTFAWAGTGAFSPISGKCTPSGPSPGTSATCSVTFTAALGGEGTFGMTATYAGDTFHIGSTQTADLTVSKRASGTAVSCAPNPDVVNAPTICTATVTDTSPGTAVTPGGMVTFSTSGSGAFSSMTCSLVAGTCSVTYTPSAGSEGTATLTASYGGDTDHTGSSITTSLTVDKRSVSIGLTCPTTADTGHAITCTVTITDTSPGTALTPKGVVSFHITGPKSATVKCTLTGSGATAHCSVKYTPPKNGKYTVTASYPGDKDHLAISVSTTFKSS
jgi:hypothetical protein